jgi:hypothetical protein
VIRRIVGSACVVGLLVGLLAGCRSGSAPGPGEARLAELSGWVQVARRGGPWSPASPGVLRSGDRVRVLEGRAVLVLAGKGRLEMRRGSTVRVDRTPELVAGDLLVLPAGREVAVAAASVRTVAGAGAAVRLRRDLAVEAGTYRGGATVSSAGRSLAIPALREATVPAPGLVPDRAGPLRLRRSDAWDRRFLLDAIVLGDELDQFSRGLTSQLPPGSARGRELLVTLLPDLASEGSLTRLVEEVAAFPPGEQVVGAAISLAGRGRPFPARWRAIFDFRGEGASWGIVAFDQGVRGRPPLVATVEEALGRLVRRPELAAPVTTGPGRSASTPITAAPPPPSPPVTVPPPPPSPPTTTTTQPPPVTVPPGLLPPPPPEDDGGLLGGVVDPLVETVGGLIGGLLGQPPPPDGGSG